MTLRDQKAPLSLGSAIFVSLLAVAFLSVLALWPRQAWKPPPRPGIHAPVVFDEFVNPLQPAVAAAPEASSAAR